MADQLIYLGNLGKDQPIGSSKIEEGDNELRIIKKSILETLPNIDKVISVTSDWLSELSLNIGSVYISDNDENNYLQYLKPPVLNNLVGLIEDYDYLSVDKDGEHFLSPPSIPLGTIFISILSQTEIDNIFPGIYKICDGSPLDNASELYKFLGVTGTYNLPDLKTMNRTVRTAGGSKALLSINDGTTDFKDFKIITTEASHNHQAESDHTHTIPYWANNPQKLPNEPAQTYFWDDFTVQSYNNWPYNTGLPLNPDGTPFVLNMDTHTHTIELITPSNDPVSTRSYEIRENYFIRIN